jgi:hypothetical protein
MIWNGHKRQPMIWKGHDRQPNYVAIAESNFYFWIFFTKIGNSQLLFSLDGLMPWSFKEFGNDLSPTICFIDEESTT